MPRTANFAAEKPMAPSFPRTDEVAPVKTTVPPSLFQHVLHCLLGSSAALLVGQRRAPSRTPRRRPPGALPGRGAGVVDEIVDGTERVPDAVETRGYLVRIGQIRRHRRGRRPRTRRGRPRAPRCTPRSGRTGRPRTPPPRRFARLIFAESRTDAGDDSSS